ncbi:Carbohydrate-binding module family 5 protein [Mycena venus]|uniref:Carbohydrate-binding module family 5 protein n=1 Tax=Mycena venus TaxID=2733690 RepID=A0A8H6Z6W6_9AGAR|nr:Carbohydrate-binding module family 5 protein [Mycena venus]
MLLIILISTCLTLGVFGFNGNRSDNIAIYWGQNSYGAIFPNATGSQQNLGLYCQDSNINTIPIAFVDVFFGTGGVPVINLADSCQNTTFPGTDLLNCGGLSKAISTCQENGIIVTISLGGGSSAVGFSPNSEAESFAETIWNTVDLDIEKGSSVGYVAFVDRIRVLSRDSTRKYYISAAPQCYFPDAYIGDALNAVGFDMLYVQFYNNPECGLEHFNDPSVWNFDIWDAWAQQSPNPNIKIYIGAPASESAAETGYVNASILGDIAAQTQSTFSSFGGVMFWDMSQAYENANYHVMIKMALIEDGDLGGEPECSRNA